MLRTRLWMGSLLVGLAGSSSWSTPGSTPGTRSCSSATWPPPSSRPANCLNLMPEAVRPDLALTLSFVAVLAVFSWWPAVVKTGNDVIGLDTWDLVVAGVVAGTVAALVCEMCRLPRAGPHHRAGGPDRVHPDLPGRLAGFLAQLRWLPFGYSTPALALTVFVPKGNDIGAYFTGKFLTGRLLGRHPMTPLLSPKKTWQGAVGGMLASVVVAVGINAGWPVILGGWFGAVGFRADGRVRRHPRRPGRVAHQARPADEGRVAHGSGLRRRAGRGRFGIVCRAGGVPVVYGGPRLAG